MTRPFFRRHARTVGIALALCSVLGVAACRTPVQHWRHDFADRISAPANLLKRQIAAGPYSITIFERAYRHSATANIYIEGDGAWTPSAQPAATFNPTPSYPLALHLASRDLHDNVIYVARPCQYSGMDTDDNTPCTGAQRAASRYSLEAMEAMNTVLDKLKATHSLTGFNLIGYDGGAAVAALLAAKRSDVLSLRTVAGVFDLGADKPAGELNPRDFAADLSRIPQHHFLGAADTKHDPAQAQNFRAAMGQTSCVRISTIAQTNDRDGWANRWPSLLTEPVDCSAP